MPVPNQFANVTTSIPLSQLDANFNTPITLGNTAIQLGNTVTTLNNMTLANATVSSGNVTVTSASVSGNLTFTGTGNRILGDFSNATIANRVLFQTSTTNGATVVLVIPNGTANTSIWEANSDSSGGTNASILQMGVFGGTDVRLNSNLRGTGTYLPMTFYTGGSERMRIDTSGNVGIGTSSPVLPLDVVSNSNAYALRVRGRSSDNQSTIQFTDNAASTEYAFIRAPAANTLSIATGNTERMRIDSSGNVGIGTSSPSRKFDVNGGARFVQDSAATTGAIVLRQNSADTVGGFIQWVNNANSVERGWMVVDTSSNMLFATGSTERARIDASGFTQFNSNLVMPYQGAPTSKSGAATLSGAELITGILNTTGTTYTITLPTGANIEGALTWSANNVSLDWYVINTASGTITIGANGNTTLGSLTIATGTSAHFRIRRTAANTFTVYRL